MTPRELQSARHLRSVILASGDTFWIEKGLAGQPGASPARIAKALADSLQNQEREIIETVLADCKGRVAGPEGAAARLGIPRSTLGSKIKQLKIKKHKFIAE